MQSLGFAISFATC